MSTLKYYIYCSFVTFLCFCHQSLSPINGCFELSSSVECKPSVKSVLDSLVQEGSSIETVNTWINFLKGNYYMLLKCFVNKVSNDHTATLYKLYPRKQNSWMIPFWSFGVESCALRDISVPTSISIYFDGDVEVYVWGSQFKEQGLDPCQTVLRDGQRKPEYMSCPERCHELPRPDKAKRQMEKWYNNWRETLDTKGCFISDNDFVISIMPAVDKILDQVEKSGFKQGQCKNGQGRVMKIWKNYFSEDREIYMKCFDCEGPKRVTLYYHQFTNSWFYSMVTYMFKKEKKVLVPFLTMDVISCESVEVAQSITFLSFENASKISTVLVRTTRSNPKGMKYCQQVAVNDEGHHTLTDCPQRCTMKRGFLGQWINNWKETAWLEEA